MAKNANAVKVRMESSAGTGYRYYKKKNPKTMTEKMKMMKYDPWATNEITANSVFVYPGGMLIINRVISPLNT